jgi:hypothetical protein
LNTCSCQSNVSTITTLQKVSLTSFGREEDEEKRHKTTKVKSDAGRGMWLPAQASPPHSGIAVTEGSQDGPISQSGLRSFGNKRDKLICSFPL